MPTPPARAPRVWNRRQILNRQRANARHCSGASRLRSRPCIASHSPWMVNPFAIGVASGDPTSDGFVLWTRLRPAAAHGGGMPSESVEVRWKVCHDEAMTRVAAEGPRSPRPTRSHRSMSRCLGSRPIVGTSTSSRALGETTPRGERARHPSLPTCRSGLRCAFASCQHFESGYSTLMNTCWREDLDLVAHLGDYIYEYAGKENQVRKQRRPASRFVARLSQSPRAVQDRPAVAAAHAICPWLVTWDDHEIANNCAGAISERNDSRRRRITCGGRMPIRLITSTMPLRRGRFRRAPTCCFTPQGPLRADSPSSTCSTRASIAAINRVAMATRNRARRCSTSKPRSWSQARAVAVRQLGQSTSVWNVLTQQVMMDAWIVAPVRSGPLACINGPATKPIGNGSLRYFAEHPCKNPIAIAGDIHCNWANNLQ